MDSKWNFTWHEQQRVLEIVLLGRWSVADAEAYYPALIACAQPHSEGGFAILSDLSGYPVQTPEVSDLHEAMLAQVQHNSPVTREAWVVAGVVATMQAKRGAKSGDQEVAIFTDRESAWSYLTTAAALAGQAG